MAKWLSKLEKKLETYSEGSHSAYRVYMSAEPAPTPDSHIIPQVYALTCTVDVVHLQRLEKIAEQQNHALLHRLPYSYHVSS